VKPETARRAVAQGRIRLGQAAAEAFDSGDSAKGDISSCARLAGILAAKRTSGLIPLCHPLRLDSVVVDLAREADDVVATCTVTGVERTGFEMEALTGVSVALLTVYDMLKYLGKRMEIGPIRLVEKSGGKSGEFRWTD